MVRRARRYGVAAKGPHGGGRGGTPWQGYLVVPIKRAAVNTISVPCPDCHAPAWQRCSGTKVHSVRRRLATRAFNAQREAWATYEENLAAEARLVGEGEGLCSVCGFRFRLVLATHTDPMTGVMRGDRVIPSHEEGTGKRYTKGPRIECPGSWLDPE